MKLDCCPYCKHDYIVPYDREHLYQCAGGCGKVFLIIEVPEL